MTRIAWITPGYPPDRGGVSDHSGAIVAALRDQGHPVLVCNRPPETGYGRASAELYNFKPELTIVAYTPLGYAPRTGGLAPAFVVWWACQRRRLGGSSLLLAHEVNLPVRYFWKQRDVKLAALGAAQIAQFHALARNFDSIAFSNEGTRRQWTKRLPNTEQRLHTIRICSNIPVCTTTDAAAELRSAGYSPAVKSILFFGSGHPSVLFDYVAGALEALLKEDPQLELVVVGMDESTLFAACPSLARLGSNVRALGYVPSREVSLWLQTGVLVLIPLIEGVNTRKGTVMAALQHGCAVVSTRGFQTLADVPWDRICALAPVDKEAFISTALACYRDSEWRARLGREGSADYEAHASASFTARELLRQAGAVRRQLG